MVGVNEIDIRNVKEMLDNNSANIVDIRDPESYAQERIPNSINLDGQKLIDFVRQGDKNKPLVVVCYRGNSSKEAAKYFSKLGFNEVYSMVGGFEAWQATFS